LDELHATCAAQDHEAAVLQWGYDDLTSRYDEVTQQVFDTSII